MRIGVYFTPKALISVAFILLAVTSMKRSYAAIADYPTPCDFPSLGPCTAVGTVIFNTDALIFGGLPGPSLPVRRRGA